MRTSLWTWPPSCSSRPALRKAGNWMIRPATSAGSTSCCSNWRPDSALPVVQQDTVEQRAGTHGCTAQLGIGAVVAANFHGLALHLAQGGDDRLLIAAQGAGHGLETLLQMDVLILTGELFSPVQGQVEMAAAVVRFADLALWRAVFFQQFARDRK